MHPPEILTLIAIQKARAARTWTLKIASIRCFCPQIIGKGCNEFGGKVFKVKHEWNRHQARLYRGLLNQKTETETGPFFGNLLPSFSDVLRAWKGSGMGAKQAGDTVYIRSPVNADVNAVVVVVILGDGVAVTVVCSGGCGGVEEEESWRGLPFSRIGSRSMTTRYHRIA